MGFRVQGCDGFGDSEAYAYVEFGLGLHKEGILPLGHRLNDAEPSLVCKHGLLENLGFLVRCSQGF